jgi:phage terminase large subunit-like protein
MRAEPISTLHARGEVDHAGTFAEPEDQAVNMTTAGYMGERLPDRADAMVWSLTELNQSKTIEIIGIF